MVAGKLDLAYGFERFKDSLIMSELAKWDSFYVIVGSAAGALIGLQFVVITLIAERPMAGAAEAGAAFSSPTVAHFGAALFLSLLLHAPWATIISAANTLGPSWFHRSRFFADRGLAYEEATHLQTSVRGLVVLCGAAVGGVRNARGIIVRSPLSNAKGLIRRRSSRARAAFQWHSQFLGQRFVPCAGFSAEADCAGA